MYKNRLVKKLRPFICSADQSPPHKERTPLADLLRDGGSSRVAEILDPTTASESIANDQTTLGIGAQDELGIGASLSVGVDLRADGSDADEIAVGAGLVGSRVDDALVVGSHSHVGGDGLEDRVGRARVRLGAAASNNKVHIYALGAVLQGGGDGWGLCQQVQAGRSDGRLGKHGRQLRRQRL